MTNNLSQETILITGATSGFGEATARLLAKEGAKLILTGRREDRLKQLQQELGKKNTYIIPLDIQDKEKVKEVFSSLPEGFKDITVLINNAGLALGLEPAHLCALDDWERMVDTNIKGLLYTTHTLLPGMVERNKGYIINIGSTAGTYPYPGGNTYGGTKAFVTQFSLNLRSDLLGTPLRVTTIAPGLAETEFSTVRFAGNQEKADNVYQNTTPLTADDIAETILWCITRPPHMNLNTIEIMPTQQACAPLAIYRKE